jgi:site-specific DNA-methyltransferase (adenine-specific)
VKPFFDHEGITIYLGDCRAVLPTLGAVDLVLTDPPYGTRGVADQRSDSRSFRRNLPHSGRQGLKIAAHQSIVGDDEPFDPSPLLQYRRLILWGGNYYADRLPPSRSWLVWDKRDYTAPDDNADCELAWTNLDIPVRQFRHLWRGVCRASETGGKSLHPTQKPVALMRWCLQRARLAPGALVLDPYMGSGPVAQACKELGYRYIGIELVEAYVERAVARLQQEVLPW